jgi:cellulose synthase/poly-beta-1,6-N-acetylglucosamine synthase-like glycosyltransferase
MKYNEPMYRKIGRLQEPIAKNRKNGKVVTTMNEPNRIAVLLPCYNEAASIGKVVTAFKEALPTATIYVYDIP